MGEHTENGHRPKDNGTNPEPPKTGSGVKIHREPPEREGIATGKSWSATRRPMLDRRTEDTSDEFLSRYSYPTDMTSALVVLSGGQDSTTCLFEVLDVLTRKPLSDIDKRHELHAVSFDYGQRHARELDSAAFVYELARQRGASRVNMPQFRKVARLGSLFEGSSPLTNRKEELELYESVSDMNAKLADRIEKTFVPGRNALFLAAACGMAVARGLKYVITGVNAADTANYPDCTPEFISAMQTAMQAATRSDVRILAPLQGASKADIVRRALRSPGCYRALAFTTTDYAGAYPPEKNHSSVLRASGFDEAGIIDPLLFRAALEGLTAEQPSFAKIAQALTQLSQ